MKRTSTPSLAAERGEVDDLVVVDAALHDGVDLDRVEPGLVGRVDAVEHPVAARRAGSSPAKRSRSSVSRLMLTRRSPAAPQAVGEQAQRGAVGRHRQVDRPGVGAQRGELGHEPAGRARTVGSPPVRRIDSTP